MFTDLGLFLFFHFQCCLGFRTSRGFLLFCIFFLFLHLDILFSLAIVSSLLVQPILGFRLCVDYLLKFLSVYVLCESMESFSGICLPFFLHFLWKFSFCFSSFTHFSTLFHLGFICWGFEIWTLNSIWVSGFLSQFCCDLLLGYFVDPKRLYLDFCFFLSFSSLCFFLLFVYL